MIGRIYDFAEEAAEYIQADVIKSVASYIPVVIAPEDKRIGHAGAITAGGKIKAGDKFKALGVRTVRSLADIGRSLREMTVR